MENIMTMIIKESKELPRELVNLLAMNDKGKKEIASPVRTQLAKKVLKNYADQLNPDIPDMVNDLDPDSTMAPATSLGYLHYPPPAVYMGNMHSIDHLSLAAPLFCPPPYPNTDPSPQLQIDSQPVDSVNGKVESSDRLQVLKKATELYEQMIDLSNPSFS